MAETLTYQFKFEANQAAILGILNNVKSGVVSIDAAVNSLGATFTEEFAGMQSAVSTISFNSILDQVDRVTNGLQQIAAPGMQFSSTLSEVSAITGVTGDALDDLAEKARASALEFGGNASDSLNTYKVILSRLGPDIAAAPQALEAMERQVRTLSKTMGGDAVAAVDAMTTAALQFGIDLSDPIAAAAEMDKMMNTMAAGSQAGAAEVDQVAASLKVSGVAMKQMNVNFEEGNAAIQALAKGGKEGAEAGTALRNVLGKMAGIDVIPKDAQDKLERLGVNYAIVSDKTLPFTDRLRELKKAQGDATIMAQVFGVENAAAANILLDSIDAQEQMTKAITDTNTAYEMAAVVMDSPAEKAELIKAKIEDLKLTIFNATGGNLLYVEALAETGRMLTNLAPIGSMLSAVYATLTSRQKMVAMWEGIVSKAMAVSAFAKKAAAIATGIFSNAMGVLNAVMLANPVLAVIAGVVALGAVVYGVTKLFQQQSAAVEVNNEVHKRAISRTADETAELTVMIETLKRTKAGTDARREAIEQLNSKYPETLKNYDLEKADLQTIDRLHRDIAASVMERAEAEVRAEMHKEIVRERLEAEQNGPGFWAKFAEGAVRFGNAIVTMGASEWLTQLGVIENNIAEDIHQKKLDQLSLKEKIIVNQLVMEEERKAAIHRWEMTSFQEKTAAAEKLMELTSGYRQGMFANFFDFKKLVGPEKGIEDPNALPGTEGSEGGDLNTGGTGKGKLAKTNSSIATGGSKQVINTFNFKSMVEHLTIAKNGFKEGVNEMQENIEEALLRTMAMAAATGG